MTEREYQYSHKAPLVSGVDEVGRGCISGPLVAAAVVFRNKISHTLLKDSKKLSEPQRYMIRDILLQNEALCGIGLVTVREIEKINVLNASILAMHRALDALPVCSSLILVDGNKFHPYGNTPHRCIIGGDDKEPLISAASIFAKVYRDEYMKELGLYYPSYRWHQNKGYPTVQHKKALFYYGATTHHRKTFRCKPITQKKLSLSPI